MRIWLVVAACASLLIGGPARAEPDDDGYCDYVEGVAAADSALLMAPQLFLSYGYIDQAIVPGVPEGSSDDKRVSAGVNYRLSGIYEGVLTRGRAGADCRRHRALGQVAGETRYQAVLARLEVLDASLVEADRMLAEVDRDLRERRASAQEVTATRLRVDELRRLAATSRGELDALAPAGGAPLGRALGRYLDADAEVERHDGRLRRMKAVDLTVRFGYDKFVTNDDTESPYFALVSVGFNVGWLLQGGGNERAAAGRRRLRAQPGQGGASAAGLDAVIARETRRAEETGVLVADLEQQLARLEGIGGEAGRAYRQTVWFEWVKLRSEHAYLEAHVAGLTAVLGWGE